MIRVRATAKGTSVDSADRMASNRSKIFGHDVLPMFGLLPDHPVQVRQIKMMAIGHHIQRQKIRYFGMVAIEASHGRSLRQMLQVLKEIDSCGFSVHER